MLKRQHKTIDKDVEETVLTPIASADGVKRFWVPLRKGRCISDGLGRVRMGFEVGGSKK
jgi:hypothetical protein